MTVLDLDHTIEVIESVYTKEVCESSKAYARWVRIYLPGFKNETIGVPNDFGGLIMNDYRINADGVRIIKSFEGIRDGNPKTTNLDPYLCPAGYWTIGWGHAIMGTKGLLTAKDREEAFAKYPGGITMEQAERLLSEDLCIYEDIIRKRVSTQLTHNQFSSLVSFVFNIGPGNFRNSTVLKNTNAKAFGTVPRAMSLWNKATNPKTGKLEVLNGLTKRRKAEGDLFAQTS